MSERIKKLFSELKNINKPAFISYITAGDPDYDKCLKIVDHLVTAGIDILELGVPFSDPLADGEANQLSAQRALLNNFNVDDVLNLVSDIRKKYKDLPIVLYTYLNPVAFAKNFKDFCVKAKTSGVDSLLLLDLTPEEGDYYKTVIDESGLSLVALVAPNTPEKRLNTIAKFASSFVYYVSREGVTGERNDFALDVDEKICKIKEHTDLPVVVGFGISTPEHVKAAANCNVDGIVVGSAIVRKIEALSINGISISEFEKFIKSLTYGLK
ncbi:MAG: tryptophan synthase subunit alpha [bacterium]|nr:tryptophan synthase subunit alpha [bacterium]